MAQSRRDFLKFGIGFGGVSMFGHSLSAALPVPFGLSPGDWQPRQYNAGIMGVGRFTGEPILELYRRRQEGFYYVHIDSHLRSYEKYADEFIEVGLGNYNVFDVPAEWFGGQIRMQEDRLRNILGKMSSLVCFTVLSSQNSMGFSALPELSQLAKEHNVRLIVLVSGLGESFSQVPNSLKTRLMSQLKAYADFTIQCSERCGLWYELYPSIRGLSIVDLTEIVPGVGCLVINSSGSTKVGSNSVELGFKKRELRRADRSATENDPVLLLHVIDGHHHPAAELAYAAGRLHMKYAPHAKLIVTGHTRGQNFACEPLATSLISHGTV
jgi:hypothetical protein